MSRIQTVHAMIFYITIWTVWTQLTYHFKWRTAIPLGPSPAPGCGEPTSYLFSTITNCMDYIFFLSLRSRKTTPNWRRITQKNKLGVGVLARIIIRTLFDLGHRKSLYGPSIFCILIFRLKPRESTASNTFKLKTFWKCWVPTVLPSNIFCKKYLVGFHRYKPIFFFLHNGFYSNIMFKVTNTISGMAPRFEVPNSAVDMDS